MKLIFSLLLSVMLAATAKAQEWTVTNTHSILTLSFPSDNTGFLGGYDGLWKTTDAGNTWNSCPGTSNGVGIVSCVGQVGFCGSTDLVHSYMHKTTNAGISWTLVSYDNGLVYMKDENVVMSSNYGNVRITGDGGATWSTIFSGLSPWWEIQGLMIDNNGKRYISMPDSFYASVSGSSWSRHKNDLTRCETGIALHDGRAYIGGTKNDTAAICSTTDDGQTWQSVMIEKGSVNGIEFKDNIGYAIVNIVINNDSTLSKIYKSADGYCWEEIYELIVPGNWQGNRGLREIASTGRYIYFGGRNTLVRYEPNSVGIHPQGQAPRGYNLEQNYPNPFNPSTVIEYSVLKKSLVVLEIYDSSGRKVGTLVNKNQDVGSYTITFTANNLSSGVYFYALRAGDFRDTKKMLLIK